MVRRYMQILSDWHIHSQNSCDGACMTVSDLIQGTDEKGIVDFGLTDHVHTPYNLPDIDSSRDEFISSDPSSRFHFGIEVSSVSQWEIDEIERNGHDKPVYGLRTGGKPGCDLAIGLSPEDIERYEIEFVVGGTHWPMYIEREREAVIRDYHRQNMFLATHPLVDIVAHPWWWMGHWMEENGDYNSEPWLDNFGVIPQSMHREFAAAAIEHETVVEINIAAMLLNPHYPKAFAPRYLEYLADLQSRGVKLSIGSDCHSRTYDIDFDTAGVMLEKAGIVDDFFVIPPRSPHHRQRT